MIGAGLLYKFRKITLAAIISLAGIFSTLFGFLYGSFFGFEELLPALWLKPKEAMITLPLIGQMNTVFVVAIAFGMFLILSPIICVCRKARVADTVLALAVTRPSPECAMKNPGTPL